MRLWPTMLVVAAAGCVFDLAPLGTATGGAGGIGEGGTTGGTGGTGGARERRGLTISYAEGVFPLALDDVPMLVVLTASNFDYDAATADGSDLRAFDAGGSPIPLELESFDPNGSSIVWVKLATVSPMGGSFALEFGDPAAAPGPGAAELWSDYTAVYHFADADPDTTVRDALNNHPGDGNNTMTSASLIGSGLLLDGATSWVDVGNAPGWEVEPGDARTISIWFQRDVPQDKDPMDFRSMALMNSRRAVGCQGWQLSVLGDAFANTNVATHIDGCNDSSFITSNPGIGDYFDEQWHHFAAILDRSNGSIRMFLDGQQNGGGTLSTAGPFASGEAAFGIGDVGDEHFEGLLDEARIRVGAVDTAWLTATVRIVQEQATLLDFGPVEVR